MSIEIVPPTNGKRLPNCTPSLMPFNISYSGFAPVSRYFLPKPAPPSAPSLAALSLHSSSAATLVAGSSSTSVLTESHTSLTAVSSTTSITQQSDCGDGLGSVEAVEQVTKHPVVDTAMEVGTETQPAAPLDDLCSVHTSVPRKAARFVAAFRGRQMFGQAVELPSGYSGLVLQAQSDSGRGNVGPPSGPLSQMVMSRSKSKTRLASRRMKRTTDDTVDQAESGVVGDNPLDFDIIDASPQARKLAPMSTFTSFTIWAPDRPLDEGRDEYVRSLVEWTRLAAEIHSYDE